MPSITAIKPQKSKNRINIYLDGKFGFGLDLENFVKFGLKVEQELSEERIIEITKKAEFQKVFDRILFFALPSKRLMASRNYLIVRTHFLGHRIFSVERIFPACFQ